MATDGRPSVSLGHVILHADDMKASVSFYETLGLCPVYSPTVPPEELVLMEMRGGTDLLILHRNSKLVHDFPVSNVGYSGYTAPVDIMIPGHDRADLEQYRECIQEEGLSPGELFDEQKYGHWYFRIIDPNGNTITVLTSHSNFE